jgi:hypothetical protein
MTAVNSVTNDFYVSASVGTLEEVAIACTMCKKEYMPAVAYDIYCAECKKEVNEMMTNNENLQEEASNSIQEVENENGDGDK